MSPPGGLWRALLSHAILAPSPHNVQPWRVRIISECEAELWIERARTLPKEDVTGSFIILTMGLFIETLRIVSAHRALRVEDELLHEPGWYEAERLERLTEPLVPFARLRLVGAPDIVPEHELAVLERRRTSRLPYEADPVPSSATATLAEVASTWSHRYVQIGDRDRIERLLRHNIDAVFEDLNHRPYRDEIAGWIRYSRSASSRHRDGLDARCMNVAAPELWLTFHAPWLLRAPGLAAWFRHRYRRQIGTVTSMGLLAGAFWDPADAYQAGRMLVHFWLTCTALGYSMHPYGNLVTNRRVAARVEAETGAAGIWLAFKIGRSAEPPRSQRRTVEEVLIA